MKLGARLAHVSLAALLLVGCADGEQIIGEPDDGGSQGTAGTGGPQGAAGAQGAAGTTGRGGSSPTGVAGTTGRGGSGPAGGRGGAAGTLGNTGAAGSFASGGRGGSNPTTGTGGRGGSAAGGRGGTFGGITGRGGSGTPDGGVGDAGGRGGSGSRDAGPGDGGGLNYNPCPTDGSACKVLPYGDSITDGIGGDPSGGGYRIDLFSRAVMANKNLTFVGAKMNGPTTVAGMPFPRGHSGYSGFTISQMMAAAQLDPAVATAPHIVLLHIATNDMRMSASGAPQRLDMLIDMLSTRLPNALIVVAKIIPYPSFGTQVTTFNTQITPIVQAAAAEGKHVILVDQFAGFPMTELGDGVHPNVAGYRRMAGVWFDAIDGLLP